VRRTDPRIRLRNRMQHAVPAGSFASGGFVPNFCDHTVRRGSQTCAFPIPYDLARIVDPWQTNYRLGSFRTFWA